MSLEQYKTQVLLLHSQQSTLDVLSTGFNDRYAVHVATSGAEALNTLGDTPIHVIVSAQDLPGMSGLDAIREAKKRSPDTIGILLAGANRQDGLEALVGDQEVFQIVRGEISPPALVNLIESATRRMRLMTLSESANDQAANVDEPASEHIVMETLDNGSNVMTDISGQVPALYPRGAQPGADPGGRAVEVLVLTKDDEFLATIGDSSRGMHTVHHANTPAQAEDIVRNNRVGVLVTDAAMVGSNIEIITHRLRSVVPRLVAVVAGRRDDGELLMDLINRGHVYRFLLKPVSPGRARLAIEASVKHHMEADDGAFKRGKPAPPGRADNAKPAVRAVPRPAAAAAPRPKPAKPAKAARKPVSNAAKQAAAKAVARPAASRRKPSPAPPTGRKKRVDPTINAPAIDPSALEDSLNDAFSETSTLTETMTGLAAAVGESLKSTGKRSRGRDGRSKLLEDPVTDDSALSPKAIIAGVAVVAVAAAAWLYSGSDDSGLGDRQQADLPADSIPTVVETDVVPQTDPAPRPGAQSTYQELLDEARTARDAGEIINPVGSNAIELYVLAREAAPNDPVVSAELEAVVEQVLGMAESAILDQRLEDADAALEKLELASPGNARLNFLRAQLDQLQLRSAADDARAAIRDGRFEDAAASIDAARQLSAGDFSGIDTVSAELDAARSEQQVDEVLALAAQRLEDGRLTSPANNNARYYYELALGNDSQNTAAKQGLVLIAGKLVLQAREAMDNGQLDEAEELLRDARALDPQSSDLSASTRALETARRTQQAAADAERQRAAEREAAAQRQAQLRQQEEAERLAQEAEADRLVEEERQSAARRAAELAAATAAAGSAEATQSGVAAAAGATTDAGTAAATLSARNVDEEASSPVAKAALTAAQTQAMRQAAAEESAAQASETPADNELEWVAISTLTRVNYVAPKYPRAAQRRIATGSVDVSFVVSTNGEVRNVEVLESTPGTIFDDAAMSAVSKWRFEPIVENGFAVEKRSAVRLAFNLQ